jgi:hypothetical protein
MAVSPRSAKSVRSERSRRTPYMEEAPEIGLHRTPTFVKEVTNMQLHLDEDWDCTSKQRAMRAALQRTESDMSITSIEVPTPKGKGKVKPVASVDDEDSASDDDDDRDDDDEVEDFYYDEAKQKRTGGWVKRFLQRKGNVEVE